MAATADYRIEHTLPASVEAEKSILGAILLDNSCYHQASEGLLRDDLSLDSHRRIYARISELADTGRPVDLVTLAEELSRHKEIDSVGGVAYLSSLTDGLPHRSNIEQYIRIVKENARRRKFCKGVEQAQRMASDPTVRTSALAEIGLSLSEVVGDGKDPLPPQFSEEALALRFSRQHADSLRYVEGWGRWMCWDGQRWHEDDTLAVFDRARRICRAASAECGDGETRIAVRLAAANTVYAVEKLARSDRKHAATTDQWDADVWQLNTPDGTVDLRTGEMRGHDPGEYLTKLTATGPKGDCDLWQHFLERITDRHHELVSFLQRVIGYSLTGVTREHAIFFMYGTGANGKSVFCPPLLGCLATMPERRRYPRSQPRPSSNTLRTLPVSAAPVLFLQLRPRTDAAGRRRRSRA